MQVIEHISEMQQWSEAERRDRRRIAFVPTMGFLHEGHLSLVREAKQRGDRVVVSIFVNPAQFSPNEDFAAYPRDFERDRRLLEKENIDILFHPPVQEIYPEAYETRVNVDKLSMLLCGAHRPGHFQGVATVVAKLFNIVRPHVAVFGEKDYQQLQLIRRLVRDLNFAIEIVGHPIVREADGLAMSSRNIYLSPAERQAALRLSRSLRRAACMVDRGETSGRAITEAVRAEIQAEPLAQVEYVTLCDSATLKPVEEIRGSALLALAVRIGKTRLIDNQILKNTKEFIGK
ncbi:MAG TPA: pantoate--beta-alanine ligase [Candidatus Binatia bacterium]|nr:pantoate--beta-alanine ligase [Candidatus Binatia bacterium]